MSPAVHKHKYKNNIFECSQRTICTLNNISGFGNSMRKKLPLLR